MKARVHVNRHVIDRNRKEGRNDPPFRVKTSKGNEEAMEVEFFGPARLVYRPDKPLSCGAVAWIETDTTYIDVLP